MLRIRPRSHDAWSSTVHLCRRTCLLQRLRASTLVIGPQVHSRLKRPCGTPAANRRAGGEHADLAKARALILISLLRCAPKPATVLQGRSAFAVDPRLFDRVVRHLPPTPVKFWTSCELFANRTAEGQSPSSVDPWSTLRRCFRTPRSQCCGGYPKPPGGGSGDPPHNPQGSGDPLRIVHTLSEVLRLPREARQNVGARPAPQ